MWTLAHAHGTILALVHVAYGTVARVMPELQPPQAPQRLASNALIGASVLLPGGFFLGGVRFYAGDPGVGIAIVPIGAALLLTAIVLIARAVTTAHPEDSAKATAGARRARS
jgi:hypothetical protein